MVASAHGRDLEIMPPPSQLPPPPSPSPPLPTAVTCGKIYLERGERGGDGLGQEGGGGRDPGGGGAGNAAATCAAADDLWSVFD
jgi:hypothetical protein